MHAAGMPGVPLMPQGLSGQQPPASWDAPHTSSSAANSSAAAEALNPRQSPPGEFPGGSLLVARPADGKQLAL